MSRESHLITYRPFPKESQEIGFMNRIENVTRTPVNRALLRKIRKELNDPEALAFSITVTGGCLRIYSQNESEKSLALAVFRTHYIEEDALHNKYYYVDLNGDTTISHFSLGFPLNRELTSLNGIKDFKLTRAAVVIKKINGLQEPIFSCIGVQSGPKGSLKKAA